MKLVAFIMAIPLSLLAAAQAPVVAEKQAPWKVTIASTAEPGERITVSGVVFGADGKTPLADASVYVYHTDIKGVYTLSGNDNRNPRLRGYMRTDSGGRYEYSTIKPGPYPGDGPPAHIHYHVNAPGYEERVFEIVFEGDPKIGEQIKREAAREGSGFSIRPLTRDPQAGWRCAQDITLRKK